MGSTKNRIVGGTPPFTIQLRNNGNLIHTVTGSDERLSVPDSYINPLSGVLVFDVSDSSGKTKRTEIDKVSWNFMKSFHIALSVSNGDVGQHKVKINESADRGFDHIGVVYADSDILDDAALDALGNSGEFNHTISHSSYLKQFDEVVRLAYTRGVKMRVSISVTREKTRLNNGTTRTKFITNDDSQQREDGTAIDKSEGVASTVIGSYGSPQFKSFVHAVFINFTKRYLPAILDGTIIAYGITTTDSAEEEMLSTFKDINNNTENPGTENSWARGDFYPTNVASFKAKYPQYNSLTNSQIGQSLLNAGQVELGNRWRRHLETIRASFVIDLINATKTAVPGLNARSKFYQYDTSSFITQIAKGNASAFQRFHPTATLIVKSNDDSIRDSFALDYDVAAARSASAICMVEPTATNHAWVERQEEVDLMMSRCKARGINISFIANDWNIIQGFINRNGLLPLSEPNEVSTLKSQGGRLVVKRFNKNLSEVYAEAYSGQTQSYSAFRNQYNSYLNAEGISAADIFVADNVSPSNI